MSAEPLADPVKGLDDIPAQENSPLDDLDIPQPGQAAKAPAPAAEAPAAEGESNPVKDEMDGLWEERYRKMQGSKDREIAELTKKVDDLTNHLNPGEVPENQPAAEAQVSLDGLDGNTFIDLINKSPNEAMTYLAKGLQKNLQPQGVKQEEVSQLVNRAVAEQDARRQFRSEFEGATNGFSDQERQAAISALEEAYQAGYAMSANEAAAIGRFGSLQNAMNYASEHVQNQGFQFPAGNDNGGDTPPPKNEHPPVPGGNAGTVPDPKANAPVGADVPALEGLYKKLF